MINMINNEDLLRLTINDIVVNSLEHMKSLNTDDRYALLEEIGFWVYTDIDVEDELLVPDFDSLIG
tara:strand:- start:161 stop:358 length:198 start_codon:yes stop_codon:yes gene_type:complete